MSSTIRIRPRSHKILKDLAAQTGESIQDALDRAIEDRQRQVYLEKVRADYDALSARNRAELQRELRQWDTTNLDGLSDS